MEQGNETIILLGSGGQGQGHRRLKLDLNACHRHHSWPP